MSTGGYHLERLRREAPARPEQIAPLRHAVASFAVEHGADEAVRAAVELGVSEALTNVVQHAYRDREEPGPMRVEAFVEPGRLAVSVSDDGVGMAPRPDSPGLGLGLPLIAQVAGDVRVERAAGTCVLMNFPLPAGQPASGRR